MVPEPPPPTRRETLHSILEAILEPAYFQPPTNTLMQYPCIRYEEDAGDTAFAGNLPYRYTKRYQVMVIDEDPDSLIPEKVAALPMCTMDRKYTADNLNHFVFSLFF